MSRARSWWPSLTTLALLGSLHAHALTLPREGWVTWEIPSVASAPNWCCFDGFNGSPKAGGCDLDSRHHGYGSRAEDDTVSQLRIYARSVDGKLTQLRSYAPSCKVTSKLPLQDLGLLPVDESLQWLIGKLQPRSKLTGDLLAAIAVHEGAPAEEKLVALAKSDPVKETRKDAIFWLGQVRGESGAARVRPFLLSDPDEDVREHAALSYSQSVAIDKGAVLIGQAKADPSAKVRSQAWFWLAQTGAPETESAIAAALVAEDKVSVRHQAIFALAQLPKSRNVKALIRVIEERSLAMEDRKQALFWLGQIDSPEALAYLDKVL